MRPRFVSAAVPYESSDPLSATCRVLVALQSLSLRLQLLEDRAITTPLQFHQISRDGSPCS